VSLFHGFESGESIACLKSDKSISILGLGSCSVMKSILHLEEDEHVSEMLFSLQVVDVLEIHGVIVVALHLIEVFVQDELHPNLTDFAICSPRIWCISLRFVEVAKVVVAAAHVGGLGPVEKTLKINSSSQFFECFFVVSLPCQEKSSEVYLQVGSVTLDLRLRNKRIFILRISTTFIIFV